MTKIPDNIELEVTQYNDLLEANRVEFEGITKQLLELHNQLAVNKEAKIEIERELDRRYEIIKNIKK